MKLRHGHGTQRYACVDCVPTGTWVCGVFAAVCMCVCVSVCSCVSVNVCRVSEWVSVWCPCECLCECAVGWAVLYMWVRGLWEYTPGRSASGKVRLTPEFLLVSLRMALIAASERGVLNIGSSSNRICIRIFTEPPPPSEFIFRVLIFSSYRQSRKCAN
jgi:hypothetical protein